jgi:formamidopyrimidine-DNA glycosylase
MDGKRIEKVEQRRKDLRWPFQKDFVARLTGKTVTGLGRRAKYLLIDLSSGDVLIAHLGMSGSFRVGEETQGEFHHPRSKARAHDHVVFHLSGGSVVTFNDPRRFGFMKIVPRAQLDAEPALRILGPEPLGNEFGSEVLARSCSGRKTTLKAALSDQKTVAGLGNIYVCEALHRAHLSPKRRAATIAARNGNPNSRAEALADAIKAVLKDAIDAGGSSLRDHRRTDGELGDFQHSFRVYDRAGEACPTRGCKGKIRRIVQGTRSTFYCPVCQK